MPLQHFVLLLLLSLSLQFRIQTIRVRTFLVLGILFAYELTIDVQLTLEQE